MHPITKNSEKSLQSCVVIVDTNLISPA